MAVIISDEARPMRGVATGGSGRMASHPEVGPLERQQG